MHFEKRTSLYLDLGFREQAIPQLKSYTELLWTTNTEFNLISRQMTQEELIDNHLIDCMLPLKKFPTTVKSVADFGSGGGLPGVVYAIQFPEIKFHLFEKSKRKQEFLNRCREIAPNITVHAEVPLTLKNIDLITARAFKPLDAILSMTRNYCLQGGQYFLLKGRRLKIDEEIRDAQKKIKEFNFEIEPLVSPVLEVERHLVKINSRRTE